MLKSAFKTFVITLICLIPFYGMYAQEPRNGVSYNEIKTKDPSALRFMSYNIRIGIGMDNEVDIKRVADVINRVNPDVVALQEVDSVTERVNWANQMMQLSELTGMYPIFGHAVDRSKGKYGIGMLTKIKPESVRKVHLPGDEEPRMLIISDFKDYAVCSTHFSLVEKDRVTSAGILIKELEGMNKPVLVGGDFNAKPGSEPVEIIKGKFNLLTSEKFITYPSDTPRVCLDYIWGLKFNNHKYNVLQSVSINEPMASDHLPLMIDIKL
ncbi:endonuclease/exonuclease/phosphatase family protein [Parabacteroides bouchesdurhonensis]|uniref:endonuclease/exonuclease/phosphatase family protein n=1 Tax=Parabacteroides bouchesdurhonensis TaxID=1936995 RepID=UPI001F262523|nr:endonuclease/exonuclease/phosphatase family protein [Parabacteroides bouchesdurhonensis]